MQAKKKAWHGVLVGNIVSAEDVVVYPANIKYDMQS